MLDDVFARAARGAHPRAVGRHAAQRRALVRRASKPRRGAIRRCPGSSRSSRAARRAARGRRARDRRSRRASGCSTTTVPATPRSPLGLAEALGWPYEIKRLALRARSRLHNRLARRLAASESSPLRSSPLEPPWPDLVIAAGRRTAPVALWIREQSAGRTRLVQLGRKGARRRRLFDLAVTPRLLPAVPASAAHRDRRAAAPREPQRASPTRASAGALRGGAGAAHRAAGRRHLGPVPARPATWRAGSRSDVMRYGAATSAAACSRRPAGGSRARRRDALCEALGGRAPSCTRWKPDDADNPYLGFLALADAFVITGDSESMLAEATRARPTALRVCRCPCARRSGAARAARAGRGARPRAAAGSARHARGRSSGLEYLCARLIERGFVRPTRDLGRLHEALVRRGVARPFGAPFATTTERAAPGSRDGGRARARAAGRGLKRT